MRISFGIFKIFYLIGCYKKLRVDWEDGIIKKFYLLKRVLFIFKWGEEMFAEILVDLVRVFCYYGNMLGWVEI